MKNHLIFVLVFIPFFGFSQEWKLVSTTDDGREIFIRSHSNTTAWIKNSNVDVYKQLSDRNPVKGEIIQLYKFDCEKLKIGNLAMVQYDDKGELIRSNQIDEVLVEMEYPIPDSYGEFYLKTFCESNY